MKKQLLKNRKKLILDFISSKSYVPMRAKDIAALLQIPKMKRKDLLEVLDILEEEDKIERISRGRYQRKKPGSSSDAVKGRRSVLGIFTCHPRGFGFVTPLEGEEIQEDIFIPEDQINGAFHRDQVEVVLQKSGSGKRREGKIIRVLSHEITEVIGTFEKSKNYGFVIPDNERIMQDIFIPKERTLGAENNQKVVVKLISYGGKQKSPEGLVREILGNADSPGIDVLSIARGYDIPMDFPEKVIAQSERVPESILEADLSGRKDLRNLMMVTIDGEDAKDLDDAVSAWKEDGLYHLGVHIADVSNYVQDRSALDREARKRGTSVYLVDRVIPMLPERLSNGICSLNAGEDRLALSCLMTIDMRGKVLEYEIAETVICVDQRMTYANVNTLLTGNNRELEEKYQKFLPMFQIMRELSGIIRSHRGERGAIDFEFPESKIILDEQGHPVEIRPYERNVATDLIEDFMLLANETVAREYCKRELPFLYRTHDNPDMEKMESVLSFIRSQGFEVEKAMEEISPKEIQKILEEIQETPFEPLISRQLLRSMKQARYTTGCSGHFGLAAKYYCHFTSPIRRYPDLQIHRIIKDDLRGRLKQDKITYYRGILEDVAKETSAAERRAQEVERETDKLKMAEFMADHLGEIWQGTISGVTAWGIYVELPNTIEGLVHIRNMTDDFYQYDEENFQLVGESAGRIYRMGDKVKVQVKDVDLYHRTIDFELKQ